MFKIGETVVIFNGQHKGKQAVVRGKEVDGAIELKIDNTIRWVPLEYIRGKWLDDCTPAEWGAASKAVHTYTSNELFPPKQDWDAAFGTAQKSFDEWMNDLDEEMVNSPSHYMLIPEKDVEVRDVMEVMVNNMEESDIDFTPMEYSDFVQMTQYILRAAKKGDYLNDLKKARFYLDELIDAMEIGNDSEQY